MPSNPAPSSTLSVEKPLLSPHSSTIAPIDLTLVTIPKEVVPTLLSLPSLVQSLTTPAIIEPVLDVFFFSFSFSYLFSNSLFLESTIAPTALALAFPSLPVSKSALAIVLKAQRCSIAI